MNCLEMRSEKIGRFSKFFTRRERVPLTSKIKTILKLPRDELFSLFHGQDYGVPLRLSEGADCNLAELWERLDQSGCHLLVR